MNQKDSESMVSSNIFKQPKDENKLMNSCVEILKRPNGAVYKGQVKNGQPHGRGTMTYKNGQRYEG